MLLQLVCRICIALAFIAFCYCELDLSESTAEYVCQVLYLKYGVNVWVVTFLFFLKCHLEVQEYKLCTQHLHIMCRR